MMAFPLVIGPEAELDLRCAVNWYNDRRSGLGEEFLDCVEEVLGGVREHPESHAIAHQSARLALVKRFPYVICYLFDGASVYVIAVFHAHRDPTAWQGRVP